MFSLTIGSAQIQWEWYIAYTMASRFHHVLTLFNDDDDVSNEHIAANGSPTDQLGLEITFESKMEEKNYSQMLLIF